MDLYNSRMKKEFQCKGTRRLNSILANSRIELTLISYWEAFIQFYVNEENNDIIDLIYATR